MNDRFKYYALVGGGLQGANKRSIGHASRSKEDAFRLSTYCLETFIPGTYRLLAKNPTTINTYYYFNIKCPDCGAKLEAVTPAQDKHILPLYACPYCGN